MLRIILSLSITILIYFIPDVSGVTKLIIYMIPYLIAGYDVLLEAYEGIKEREIFDENFLMAVSTIGCFILAFMKTGDYNEAIAVMIFYKVGEFFEDYATDKSRKNIIALMDIRAEYANIEADGKVIKADPQNIKIGSIIIVKPGEKIPIDGTIIEGKSNIDMSALTGESIPKNINVGDEVLSGSINLNHAIKIKTTKNFENSTVSKILNLIEQASEKKSKSENFITRFAKIYTPFVCISALILAFVPALIFGDFSKWVYRALTFLVISCPCALVISIPLTFFAGIGGAGRNKILIKGSNYIEALSRAKIIIFDKTGTLTKGNFEVRAVHPDLTDENNLLHLAAHVERFSNHPVANSLKKAYPNESDDCKIEDVEELAGYGVRARVNNNLICVGNLKFMDLIKADVTHCEKCDINKNENSGSIIHVAINNKYAGHIIISDVIKSNSSRAISELKNLGFSSQDIIMLTGDSRQNAEQVAKELKIKNFYAELLPSDKVNKIEEIINKNRDNKNKNKIIFAGDGINDAPVLARSDVGIAMGGLGSDAAIEAADVVLMDDDPGKIPVAIKISRKCMSIVKQNIIFAIGIKLLCLIFGAFGFVNMWLAVFADVGVMVIAVLNALRALFL